MKRYIAASLITVLLHATVIFSGPVHAKSSSEREAKRVTKAKASVLKLGTGEAARVKLKLLDGSRLEGYISQTGENSFVLMNAETKTSTVIPYPQVGQVKRNNLTKSTWITIGVLAAVGVVVTAVLLKRCGNEGGC